jgi:hypothetical protein
MSSFTRKKKRNKNPAARCHMARWRTRHDTGCWAPWRCQRPARRRRAGSSPSSPRFSGGVTVVIPPAPSTSSLARPLSAVRPKETTLCVYPMGVGVEGPGEIPTVTHVGVVTSLEVSSWCCLFFPPRAPRKP